ncbi:hypothetical protein M3205_16810 [Cytobacillus firmus]|uniref:hypothetical protein n=1 Tax=Cytobacillus firmus TaxID=1399 RepID=UPI00203D18AC|nr:hypothetical protein [Cytobacillus firmus]MCM3707374.1 hypothetical protein [Cytobacillus firmus]
MSEKIRGFCELIAEDYTYYLYNFFNVIHKGKINTFPWCCHASANLIASYLKVHFDESFVHKKMPGHGVSVGRGGYVDFTEFQFNLTAEQKHKFKMTTKAFTKNEVYTLIKRQPIFYSNETIDYQIVNTSSFGECTLFGVEFAKKIKNPQTLDGFMEYVEKSIEKVGERVVNAGVY